MSKTLEEKKEEKLPDVVCILCEEKYNPPKYVYGTFAKICETCKVIAKEVRDPYSTGQIDPDVFLRNKYSLKLVYKDHDDCLDADTGDIFRLLKIFKNQHLDKNNFILPQFWHLVTGYYLPEDVVRGCCAATYLLKSAEVILTPPEIDLEDFSDSD